MLNLFSDIDGTIVYSHRHPPEGTCVVAEYLNGYVQSYMTARTHDFLSNTNEIQLVPVTTRTVEQYGRLSKLFSNFNCRYALVCNGGILLDNNEVDQKWLSETVELARDEIEILHDVNKLLIYKHSKDNIHFVENVMTYFKPNEPSKEAEWLTRQIQSTKITVTFDLHKVYCIPSSITKGNAVKRFEERTGIECSVAAGDSQSDISMLELAGKAILPDSISDGIVNPHKYVFNGKTCFSDYICDVVTMLQSSGK